MSTHRILMLTARFWPTIGGAQTHVFELTRALTKLGLKITILAEKNPRNLPFREDIGSVNVYRLPITSYCGALFPAYLLLSIIVQFKFHAKVIHAHFALPCGLVGLLLSKVFRVPLVITVHGIDIVRAPEIRYGIRLNPAIDLLTSFILRRANHVIACSDFVRERVLECGVDHERISVIPNAAADLERKALAAETGNKRGLRLQLGLPPESFLLFAPRRIVKKNGIEYLIRAAEVLVHSSLHFYLVISGDGPLRRSLEDLSAKLGLNARVRFLGEVNEDTLDSLYVASDVVVIPSVVEAFGLPVVEAMAYHRPIITFDCGGPAEIVEREATGIVVKETSGLALAEAVLCLASNSTMVAKFRENSASSAQKYNWEQVAEHTRQLYESVLPARRYHASIP